MIWRLLRRVLLWHAVGIFLGGLGLALGYFTAALLGGTTGSELIAAFTYMGVYALIAFTAFTPVAVVLLAAWSYGTARLPSLEPPALFRRLLVLSAVAALLTLPVAVGTILVLGMDSGRDPGSPLMRVTGMVVREWRMLFTFFPAAFGWFVVPRMLVPSLRGRFGVEEG
ncbi:MAG: hypothetical protein IPP98_05485 [Gemmatimonadetes bacterium]|nr:hypothetical protein [Gemmatimonadota bacterium]MBL0178566.1 hypothetical protein [Gemmatimonadota bacterium]